MLMISLMSYAQTACLSLENGTVPFTVLVLCISLCGSTYDMVQHLSRSVSWCLVATLKRLWLRNNTGTSWRLISTTTPRLWKYSIFALVCRRATIWIWLSNIQTVHCATHRLWANWPIARLQFFGDMCSRAPHIPHTCWDGFCKTCSRTLPATKEPQANKTIIIDAPKTSCQTQKAASFF